MMVATGISEYMHAIHIVITTISVVQTSMLYIVGATAGELTAEEAGTTDVLSVCVKAKEIWACAILSIMVLSITTAHLEATTITVYSAEAEMIVPTTATMNIITAKHSVMTTITDQTEYLVTAQAVQELQHLMVTEFSEVLEVETT